MKNSEKRKLQSNQQYECLDWWTTLRLKQGATNYNGKQESKVPHQWRTQNGATYHRSRPDCEMFLYICIYVYICIYLYIHTYDRIRSCGNNWRFSMNDAGNTNLRLVGQMNKISATMPPHSWNWELLLHRNTELLKLSWHSLLLYHSFQPS